MIFLRMTLGLFALVSFQASAAYYWTVGSTQYSSPEEACTVLLTGYTEIGWSNITFDHYGGLSSSNDPDVDGYGFCFYSATNKWGETSIRRHASMISRGGYADPEPVDSCANAPSAVISRGPYGPVTVSDGKKYVLSPSPATVCSENCLYEKPETSNTKDCFTLSDDPQTGFCNYGFTLVTSDSGAGTSCSVNTAIPYETGASLNAGDTGDGGDDGTGSGGDGTGSGGDGSGSGGDGSGTGGDGSDSGFSPPGNADLDLRDEARQVRADLLMHHISSTWRDSQFTKDVTAPFDNMAQPAAVCPTPTIDILGESITIDTHCWLFAQVEPILKIVFMAAWLLIGGLIILSA